MHVNKPGIYVFFAYLVKNIFFRLFHDTCSCYFPIISKVPVAGSCRHAVVHIKITAIAVVGLIVEKLEKYSC